MPCPIFCLQWEKPADDFFWNAAAALVQLEVPGRVPPNVLMAGGKIDAGRMMLVHAELESNYQK